MLLRKIDELEAYIEELWGNFGINNSSESGRSRGRELGHRISK